MLWYMVGTSGETTFRTQTLAAMLTEECRSSGLSSRKLGPLMGVSHVTVGRWLRGESRPSVEHVVEMLAHLGINGERKEGILDVARRAHEPDWLTTGDVGVTQQLAAVMEVERTATAMVDWSPLCIPGMLQTASYARAIIGTNRARTSTEVDHLVNLRLGRQNALIRESPVQLAAFIGEPAIRGGIGGPAVMAEQLRYLTRVAGNDAVTVQVVPVEGEWHAGLAGPFLLYERAGMASIVHLEHHRTGSFVTDEADVTAYQELVHTLRDVAWSPDQSRQMIAEQIEHTQETTP